jgi:hypothetical protein
MNYTCLVTEQGRRIVYEWLSNVFFDEGNTIVLAGCGGN